MKFVLAILLVAIALFLLGMASAVGFTVFLEMTRFVGDSDQEYGIYAYWIWTILSTALAIGFSSIFAWLLARKLDTPTPKAVLLSYVVFILLIGLVVATATGIGFGVAIYMDGGF